jgi:hypothetical protein
MATVPGSLRHRAWVVFSNVGEPFAKSGDSGSWVLTSTGEVTAIVIGGESAEVFSIVTPIKEVLVDIVRISKIVPGTLELVSLPCKSWVSDTSTWTCVKTWSEMVVEAAEGEARMGHILISGDRQQNSGQVHPCRSLLATHSALSAVSLLLPKWCTQQRRQV